MRLKRRTLATRGVAGGVGTTPAASCAALLMALGVVFGVPFGATASADEPVAAKEPRLMSETSEITSVVDAFDGTNIDANFTIGFSQSFYHANIRRETGLFQPGLSTGGFVARTENVATYSQATSALDFGIDLGIFRDLALVLRLPVILADSRGLGDLDGSSRNPQRLQDPSGGQLFTVPHNAPNRSGVDWFSAGLDYAIFNQQRDQTKPTWVVGVEGRFAVGPALHACNADAGPGQPKCPDPDQTRHAGVDRDPGISRAMVGIGAHTVFSRRYNYVEPYMGFWFLAEVPEGYGDFAATNNLKGSLVNHPPLLGTFGVGVEVVPYEAPEQFRRFVADFRVKGTYHSAGREYSELFDALGSSQAPSLRNPNPGGYTADPANPGKSIVDSRAQQVFFSGITDQQAFGSLGTTASGTWQAGEHIKFQAGLGFTFNQSHLITAADACNPDFQSDPGAAGPCHGAVNGPAGSQTVTGIPNPNQHPVIDSPGRRFSVDDGTIVDLWLMGVVMF